MTEQCSYMTVQQAADKLGLSVGQILNSIRLNKLQAVKTQFAILPEELEAFQAEFVRVKSTGEAYVRRPRAEHKTHAQLRVEALRQARAEKKAQARATRAGSK
ncbi:hypothetical protein [Deinococcus sp. Leaf326]|uniref:hypothetical protein n=1 Tax=Deinococcus sp. Leaf326 TaxID=1736338 RepID=UPI0006F8EAA7|nr:hypothetical protein [Deinococcus sp. Leaf326]KQR27266.1 hypothetical protein ASF71_17745 [Deinococcus sp. Leaf326]